MRHSPDPCGRSADVPLIRTQSRSVARDDLSECLRSRGRADAAERSVEIGSIAAPSADAGSGGIRESESLPQVRREVDSVTHAYIVTDIGMRHPRSFVTTHRLCRTHPIGRRRRTSRGRGRRRCPTRTGYPTWMRSPRNRRSSSRRGYRGAPAGRGMLNVGPRCREPTFSIPGEVWREHQAAAGCLTSVGAPRGRRIPSRGRVRLAAPQIAAAMSSSVWARPPGSASGSAS